MGEKRNKLDDFSDCLFIAIIIGTMLVACLAFMYAVYILV